MRGSSQRKNRRSLAPLLWLYPLQQFPSELRSRLGMDDVLIDDDLGEETTVGLPHSNQFPEGCDGWLRESASGVLHHGAAMEVLRECPA